MKEQLERQIDILRHAKIISVNHGNFECGASFKELEFKLREELEALNTKEERTFKNKDFHVKVWQDSEKLGIETVWIREGFEYHSGILCVDYSGAITTTIGEKKVWFGNCIRTSTKYKCDIPHTYSDIVTELENAHKLSSEVSIWDVIKECEGVTDREELNKILSKYEVNLTGNWIRLEVRAWYLDNPIDFINRSYQLRLKDPK